MNEKEPPSGAGELPPDIVRYFDQIALAALADQICERYDQIYYEHLNKIYEQEQPQ